MGPMLADNLPKDSSDLKGIVVRSPEPTNAPPPTSVVADPRFLDALLLEYIDGHDWKVVHEFIYRTDVGGLWKIKVPAGFVTDFASVPKVLWNVMPPTGMYGKAAVIHDFLYRTPHIASRENADNVFREAMEALGVGWFTRNVMFRGVRMFGGAAYKGGL